MNQFKKFFASAAAALLALNAYLPVFAGSLYSDVSDSDIDFEGIRYCKEHGIMTGTTETTFAPDRSLTRGEMITILWRMEGCPDITQNGFADVPADSFYKPASNWAKVNGVMTGNLHGDGSWTFDGNNPLTKEQASLIMYRYAKNFKGGAYKGSVALPGWISSASPWSYQGVEWALSNNLARHSNESYYPLADSAPRSWMATFIQRFLDESYSPGPGDTTPSNPSTPADPGNSGNTTQQPVLGSGQVLDQYIASKGYQTYTQGNTGLQYAEYDLNRDGNLELLIQKRDGVGFFFTWTFMVSGGNVIPVKSDYGYGMYRYSPSFNAVITSSIVKPNMSAGDAPFMTLDYSGYHPIFTLITDMGQFYKAMPDGSKIPITQEQNQAHFADQVRFDWKNL